MWEVGWQVEGETSAASIMDALNERLSVNKWTRADKASKGAAKSIWRFTDEDGGVWSGTASAIEKVKALYATLCDEERRHSSAPRAAEAGVAKLQQILAESKLTYDQFVFTL